MTEVRFENNGSHFFIGLSGHAGDKRVCAGCSLLATMVAQLLTDCSDIKVKSCMMSDGECAFDFDTEKAPHVDTQMFTILRGFELLENEHPDNVHLTSLVD